MASDSSGFRRRSRLRLVLTLLLAALAVVAAGYYLQRHGISLTGALSTVQESSEDAATTAKVKASLALSKRVSGFDIEVETRGGVVQLRGEVPSQEAKNLVETIVGDTSGVRSVDSELTVDPAARRDPEITRLQEQIEELEVKAAVREGLATDPELAGARIEVRTEGAAVTLLGTVQTLEQKLRAEQVARRAAGSEGVENRLEVTEPRDDAGAAEELAERVEFELYKTKAFDLEGIQITAEGGQVTLAGTVRSTAEKLLAVRIAGDVRGVTGTVDRLQVAPAQP